MKKRYGNMSNLINRKELFWEISPDRIAQVLRESDDWVIVRVFQYGTVQDIYSVIDLYGEEKVKDVLTKEELQPMSACMAHLFFGIDRNNRYAL